MKVLITLLLTMSLSGTTAYGVYWILVFFCRKRLTASFRYAALKLCLLFYLLPFPLAKHLLFQSATVPNFPEQLTVYHILPGSLNQTTNGFLLNTFSPNQKIILTIWLLILLLLSLFQLRYFLQIRSAIRISSSYAHQYDALLDTIKRELKIRRTVQLCACNVNISPFTYGIFHPTVLLTEQVVPENADLVLRYELQHIKNLDFLFRLFALFTVYLHCFNPAIYFFFREFSNVQELFCDEQLLIRCSPKERKRYGNILIDLAASPSSAHGRLSVYFSKNQHAFFKERILQIVNYPKRNYRFAPLLLLPLFLLPCIPIGAYEPETIDWRLVEDIEEKTVTMESLEAIDWFSMESNPDPTSVLDSVDETAFQYTDQYFLLEDGTVIPLEEEQPHASCTHTWKNGQIKKHLKTGNGCTVTIYSAQRCSQCSAVRNKTYLNKIAYDICPHKSTPPLQATVHNPACSFHPKERRI